METVKITSIKTNPANPRKFNKTQLDMMCKSITDFPEMLRLRPLVVDDENIVLGGNLRLIALIKLGHKEVPILRASKLTNEQKLQFIIKDNIHYGEWNESLLLTDWNDVDLEEWGLKNDNKKDADEFIETTLMPVNDINFVLSVKVDDVVAIDDLLKCLKKHKIDYVQTQN